MPHTWGEEPEALCTRTLGPTHRDSRRQGWVGREQRGPPGPCAQGVAGSSWRTTRRKCESGQRGHQLILRDQRVRLVHTALLSFQVLSPVAEREEGTPQTRRGHGSPPLVLPHLQGGRDPAHGSLHPLSVWDGRRPGKLSALPWQAVRNLLHCLLAWALTPSRRCLHATRTQATRQRKACSVPIVRASHSP